MASDRPDKLARKKPKVGWFHTQGNISASPHQPLELVRTCRLALTSGD